MTAKARILVVEDEEDVSTYVCDVLTEAGYDVALAEDGEEALEAVRRDPPDLVSLDITMPRMTGVKFYRLMRESETTRRIPIVIVTGISNPWESARGTGGFQHFISSRKKVPPPDGFFEKPLDRDAFLARVGEILGGGAA